jgi:hypothetical protein
MTQPRTALVPLKTRPVHMREGVVLIGIRVPWIQGTRTREQADSADKSNAPPLSSGACMTTRYRNDG